MVEPNIVEEVNIINEKHSKKVLNQALVQGIDSIYATLLFKGFLLPELTHRCITIGYLVGVANNTYFNMQCKEVRPIPTYRTVTARALLHDLKQKLPGQKWGFDFESPPEYEWLVKVASFVISDHEIFQPFIEKVDKKMIDFPKEYINSTE